MGLIKGLSLNWPKHLTMWVYPLGAKTCEDASSRASSSCGVSVEARKRDGTRMPPHHQKSSPEQQADACQIP